MNLFENLNQYKESNNNEKQLIAQGVIIGERTYEDVHYFVYENKNKNVIDNITYTNMMRNLLPDRRIENMNGSIWIQGENTNKDINEITKALGCKSIFHYR